MFGRNADTVKKWASGAAESMGLARSEYAEFAALLGGGLKMAGIDDYTRKSDKLLRLGADLAATYGGPVSDAVSALGSLMRGEADPIERYNVSIKQSDVNARLAAQGQDKLTGAARKTAEMTARLQLLFEQTTDAQGAFRRESNTLAGAQERLRAKWENLKDTLGRKLLPVGQRVLEWLGGVVDGSNDTGRAAVRMWDKLEGLAGWLDRNFGPNLRQTRNTINRVSDAFDDGRRAGSNYADAVGKADRANSRFGEGMRGRMGIAATMSLVSISLEKGAGFIGTWTGRLEASWAVAEKYLDAIWRLREALLSIPKVNFPSLPNLPNIPGLGRSGEDPGLTRAISGGYVGGYGSAPPINLTSSPSVRVEIDSAAMARLFRVIVRDELKAVGINGGSVNV